MQILAHRGFWGLQDSTKQIKPNSLESFKHAFQNGFGIESDLRDFDLQLVISHDMPTSRALRAQSLFALYKNFLHNPPLALNIKSDGLQVALKALLEKYRVKNYFCFDMSVPDMRIFAQNGLNFFTRISEIEQKCVLYDEAQGVWCDEFYSHWISESTILAHLENGKKVAIVSPELHKRQYLSAWRDYKQIIESNALSGDSRIFLCTDFPHLAKEFFNE